MVFGGTYESPNRRRWSRVLNSSGVALAPPRYKQQNKQATRKANRTTKNGSGSEGFASLGPIDYPQLAPKYPSVQAGGRST